MALRRTDVLAGFHAPTRTWFLEAFGAPTLAQEKAWPPILSGRSTLLLAPTGSGKTLAAFLSALDRLMFSKEPPALARCRVLYISPLKALAVDVEKNLRVPLAGIAAAALRAGAAFREPAIAIRSGDTPADERARMLRHPPDIWITTPESLYLLLTSSARERLRSIEVVIVDEIHALVGTKRGAHLFLSLERLEQQRPKGARPLQRIGLSATQRPLDEVARQLAGVTRAPRPVAIVDAGRTKTIELTVEVPSFVPGTGESGKPRSIWTSIHPRLVELIRAHRSTMVFVNSRRLAERLAIAINETAGEELALAHHGSLARERRQSIEDRLKRGDLRALVATSSLELGIDMGAVDLVVQIEAPPSVGTGLQRIGRARHTVGGVSRGIVFPKYRGDLLAAAAAARSMREAAVEETFAPQNPLDVLAQQIVAMVSMDDWKVGDLYAVVRRAAPFSSLPRRSFDSVLDMLSGRYPSDQLADLRPRITWNRAAGTVRAREGAKKIAVVNAGTIPDRGLYGVFLATEGQGSRRVGELDEEMVFESKPGEVFLLGASSWRIENITHDRVMVVPAPGRPGKMPFWHGDRPGRPLAFGRAIGELSRRLASSPDADAIAMLVRGHALDERAAEELVRYVREQQAATGHVPSDRTIVVERYTDEMGDLRVCILSPFGSRVHAPWATAAVAACRQATGAEVDMLWSDDGIVLRLPESDTPPDTSWLLPSPEDVEQRVALELGKTSLFAARFRENAARALLLPRRRPGRRTPLWAQRRRAADLLTVAARFGSFPIILETYRECLRDVFDLPGLSALLADIRNKKIRLAVVDSRRASPFAASLLFSYVGNFIYDQDAPLAERRALALSVDQAELRELIGEADLRELFDSGVISDLERQLQRRRIKSADGVHDALLSLGALSRAEIEARADEGADLGWLEALDDDPLVIRVRIAGELRYAAVEDASRLRDALGIVLPPGVPPALLEPVADPLGDLVSRFARTHGPFTAVGVADHFGIGVSVAKEVLLRLAAEERVVEGDFLPGRQGREWCDVAVFRTLKQRSLARLRKQVEPMAQEALARLLPVWQGVGAPRTGIDGLLDVLSELQGAAVPASVLESEILPARLAGYRPSDLDALCAAGDVLVRGIEPLGTNDGRIALYLADRYDALAPPRGEPKSGLASSLLSRLESKGALFFPTLVAETKLYPRDVLSALWELFWAGLVTNDTFAAVRSMMKGDGDRPSRSPAPRTRAPGGEGRWSLLPAPGLRSTETERRKALVEQLLLRHGVLTREAILAEGTPGGLPALYDVLRAMEEAGRARRGYFVAGLGAMQFALPGADDRLRSMRDDEADELTVLGATDPANAYGAALHWPERASHKPGRLAGALVILHRGALAAYLGPAEKTLLVFVHDDGARAGVARVLAGLVDGSSRRALLIESIDGAKAEVSALAPHLVAAGFTPSSRGFLKRAGTHTTAAHPERVRQ